MDTQENSAPLVYEEDLTQKHLHLQARLKLDCLSNEKYLHWSHAAVAVRLHS